MTRTFRQAMLLAILTVAPFRAEAGWVLEWSNVASKPEGGHMAPQPSSMAIAGGRMRLAQPEVITLIDYNTSAFSVLNPKTQVFWTGTIEDYARHVAGSRAKATRQLMTNAGKKGDSAPLEVALPKVDPATLPPISITKDRATEKIAGYDTVKYVVQVDGDRFQELWVAPALDMSADLNADRYLAYQRTMGAGMAGKAAGQYNALYLSDQYRSMIEKAFILKMITHHMAGTFERSATSVRQADVADSEFTVPDEYRKVKLADVLPAPPAANPSSAGTTAIRPGGR